MKPRFSPENMWFTVRQISQEVHLPVETVSEVLENDPALVRAANLEADNSEPVYASRTTYNREVSPIDKIKSVLVNRVVGQSDFVSGIPPIVSVGAWGFAGGSLAGVCPLIQDSKVPKGQQVDKGRLFYVINFIVLPIIGAFIACLAQTQCTEIDPVMSTFAGYAAPSLLQKWQNDDLIL